MTTSAVGFTVSGAFDGIVSQLGTTFPAAVSVFLAACMNLGAGAVLVRILRWGPFDSVSQLMLSGLVGAVLLDALLLFALGPFGFFKPLSLAFVNLGILGIGVFIRPWLIPGERRLASFNAATWLIVAVVWSAALILQLASPVVPFLDVLPNHVAPVQHLQTYGTWGSLVVNPSPIYGPSRLFLGYTALLGTLVVLTGKSAALVVAAFALPMTILVAAGATHLANAIAPVSNGAPRTLGEQVRSTTSFWVLLTIPLTFVFLRIPDARDSVLVFPLVSFALAVLVGDGTWGGRSRPVMLAAAIAAAVLVHPLGGAFLAATVGLVAVISFSPGRFRLAVAGLVGAGIASLPQVAVMLGVSAPAWAALPAIPVGLGVAAWLAEPVVRGATSAPRPPARDFSVLTMLIGAVLIGTVAVAAAALIAIQPKLQDGVREALTTSLQDYGVLLVAGAFAVLLVRSLDAWRVTFAALFVGAAAIVVAKLWPGDSILSQSIQYEVPKAVGYWLPWFVAIAGGLGLAALWDSRGLPQRVRIGGVALFVVLAAIDFAPGNVEALGIEQHRYSDSLAISLHEAESGYWVGYPDSRTILDPPRQALLDAVQAEQASGRLGPASTVLHVAPSFQQWVATPLGVFAGVIETDATEDPEHSLHTAGGRLEDVADLETLLAKGFDYVVIEGYPGDTTYLQQAEAAGYQPIWQNEQAVLLRR